LLLFVVVCCCLLLFVVFIAPTLNLLEAIMIDKETIND